ncbi:MAG: ornithine cyclodeaminase family protein [Woeseiaceae bacterium]|nr:ornithine cyclodeaminase family protein [Woeseiaceae bacterium]
MITADAQTLSRALPYDQLINALDKAFAADIEVPLRAHHTVPVPGGTDGTLMLMPAWQAGKSIGIKIATVFPDNAKLDSSAVFASYLLLSAESGVPVAQLDGAELTVRRTAAASALASRYLSRENSSRLLMVGTGNLAPQLVMAHATARPISDVLIWGRRESVANDLAMRIAQSGLTAQATGDLESAVSQVDIISCATLASDPLIKGEWLSEGQHLDLVGAFRPDMREADDEALRRADVYVDTRTGGLSEAGEIVQGIASGAISKGDICGELSDLAMGGVLGRQDDAAITLFKSVGTALEDLAAAELAVQNFSGAG